MARMITQSDALSRLFSAVVVLLYVYIVSPMLIVIYFSFSDRSFFNFPPEGFSLRWYAAAWQSGVFLEPAIRSVLLGLAATALAGAVTIPAAMATKRSSKRAAALLEFVFLSPLIVPGLILGIALLYFFTQWSLIDTIWGLLAAHTVLVVPFMFRSVLVAVQELDEAQLEASAVLGASARTTFRRVTLPQLKPGLIAGAIFAFIVSFDQFTLSLFVVRNEQVTLPIALYQYLYDVNDPVTSAVGSVLVALGLAVTMVLHRFGLLKHLSATGA